MYGTQTATIPSASLKLFENDVKMYGTQTAARPVLRVDRFENDVKFIFVNNKNR